jgi:hypothetical protein
MVDGHFHYIEVGDFEGDAGYYTWGLASILTLLAAVRLLFPGTHP